MGLIQSVIEKAGIPTVGISSLRRLTEAARPPRTVFLGWPFGHPLGEPFNEPQQRTVLREALKALYVIEEPGGIVELPFKWRRHVYEDGL